MMEIRELPYDYDIHDIARTVDDLVGAVNELLEQQSYIIDLLKGKEIKNERRNNDT